MMQHRIVSLAAALFLAGGGVALAGSAGAGSSDYPVLAQYSGNIQTPQSGGAVKNPPGGHSSLSNVNLAPVGQWAIGRTLWDREGNAVGVIKRLHENGDALVVSVEQYAGIGPRDIVLDKRYLNQSGSGADMELITNLTKSQIAAQPTVASNQGTAGTGGTGNAYNCPCPQQR